MIVDELKNLGARVEKVRQLISEHELALAADPSDLGSKLSLSSLRSHLDDLILQTRLLEAEHK